MILARPRKAWRKLIEERKERKEVSRIEGWSFKADVDLPANHRKSCIRKTCCLPGADYRQNIDLLSRLVRAWRKPVGL